jgi:predicted O-methyltransferase YrrM
MMSGDLRDARRRLALAVRNPGYALRVLARATTGADERFIARITGSSAAQIRQYIEEPRADRRFAEHMRECERACLGVKSVGADFAAKKTLLQYAVIRAAKPRVVVETVVANGVSTSHALLALEKNGGGALTSIDIGDPVHLPPGRQPGWIVPDWLHSRWRLVIGDARDVLGGILRDLGAVDMFIHDSLHTYTHMMFEFELAYPRLRAGGILIADDASWNSAFREFCGREGSVTPSIVRGVGITRKP